jgi:hypothetical protein
VVEQSNKFDDCDDEISDIITREDAWTEDGDGKDNKVDIALEDPSLGLCVPHTNFHGNYTNKISVRLRNFHLFLQKAVNFATTKMTCGRFRQVFLWGESFGDGRLDAILAASAELRSTILELCTTISTLLIRGEQCNPSELM